VISVPLGATESTMEQFLDGRNCWSVSIEGQPMSIIESITGIFSSKKEPKKARERKAAPKSDAPKRASAGSSAAKKTGAAPAMSAHSKDAASKGKSGQPKAPAKKKAAH
jgi:hypothetical protein